MKLPAQNLAISTKVENSEGSTYWHADAEGAHTNSYLLPVLDRFFFSVSAPRENKRVLDLGCGSGSIANHLANLGYDVTAVDPSESGISLATAAYPKVRFEIGTCYENLAARFGTFPVVTSLEVVEHLYFPRRFASCLADLLSPGGTAIVSTPFHGYWKNLALAISGKLDDHFTALWDHGHIKFFSERTFSELLNDAGLEVIEIVRAGRISPLARSMVAFARKRG